MSRWRVAESTGIPDVYPGGPQALRREMQLRTRNRSSPSYDDVLDAACDRFWQLYGTTTPPAATDGVSELATTKKEHA